MNIWFAENEKKVRESVAILPVSIKDRKATYTNEGENVFSIVDGKHPKNSKDTEIN